MRDRRTATKRKDRSVFYGDVLSMFCKSCANSFTGQHMVERAELCGVKDAMLASQPFRWLTFTPGTQELHGH